MRPILLVEDDPNDALLVRDTLEQVNLINEIDVATTVEAARAYVRRNMPALIISDIHLPGESGLDFLHWLREQPGGARQRAGHHDERLDGRGAPSARLGAARPHLHDQANQTGSASRPAPRPGPAGDAHPARRAGRAHHRVPNPLTLPQKKTKDLSKTVRFRVILN